MWFSLKYAIYLMMLMFMSNGKAVKCLDEIPWNCSHVKETELHPFSLLLHPEAGVVLVLLKPHTLWCNHGGNHNDCASTVIWFLVHYITARARCQWIPWISTKNKQKKSYEIKMKMFSMSWGRVNETKYSRLIKTVVLILLVKLCCENWAPSLYDYLSVG